MSNLLGRFLETTAAPNGVQWSKDQVAVLEAAPNTLEPAVSAQEETLAALPRCGHRSTELEKAIERNRELTQLTRTRLEKLPDLTRAAVGAREVAKWRAGQEERRKAAREEWCPPKPKPGKVTIFYASQDEAGINEWFFCDGFVVRQAAGAAMERVDPADLPQGKKPPPVRGHLEAAKKYPEEEIARAPRLDVQGTQGLTPASAGGGATAPTSDGGVTNPAQLDAGSAAPP